MLADSDRIIAAKRREDDGGEIVMVERVIEDRVMVERKIEDRVVAEKTMSGHGGSGKSYQQSLCSCTLR